MRKGMWSAAALILLLSGVAVLWVSTVQAADNNVTMKDQLEFDPADISVPVGTAVVFRNGGNIPHDAKADDGSFSTPMLDPGKEHSVTFGKGGNFTYYCTVEGHKAAGMIGTVHVIAGGSTPITAAPTATTAATTATTVPGQGATTTTTAKGTAGASSTTTTAAANGATTTTLAPAGAPASAPETAGETTTTATAHGGGEEAAADHSREGEGDAKKEKKKNSPIGIAFASVSTLLLAGIAGKLLASKS